MFQAYFRDFNCEFIHFLFIFILTRTLLLFIVYTLNKLKVQTKIKFKIYCIKIMYEKYSTVIC